MGDISKNFNLSEFEKTSHSEYAGQNRITDPEIRENLTALVNNVLQPLRDAWGGPLTINSGYRCPGLNKAVGGVATSQHLSASAADVSSECTLPGTKAVGYYSHDLAALAKSLNLPFDQMILYNHFVHFSHRRGGPQRGQILYNSSYREQKL